MTTFLLLRTGGDRQRITQGNAHGITNQSPMVLLGRQVVPCPRFLKFLVLLLGGAAIREMRHCLRDADFQASQRYTSDHRRRFHLRLGMRTPIGCPHAAHMSGRQVQTPPAADRPPGIDPQSVGPSACAPPAHVWGLTGSSRLPFATAACLHRSHHHLCLFLRSSLPLPYSTRGQTTMLSRLNRHSLPIFLALVRPWSRQRHHPRRSTRLGLPRLHTTADGLRNATASSSRLKKSETRLRAFASTTSPLRRHPVRAVRSARSPQIRRKGRYREVTTMPQS